MNLVLLGSITRHGIVVSTLVRRHRQIPVIQQSSGTARRGDRHELWPWIARVSELPLEQ